MGKGSKESSTQKVETDVPEFIKPYIIRMMDRGEAASEIPYLRYPGERVAGLTPTTRAGINMVRGLAGLPAERPLPMTRGAPRSATSIPYVDIPDEFKKPSSPPRGQIAALEKQIRDLRSQISKSSRGSSRVSVGRDGGQAGEGSRDRDRGNDPQRDSRDVRDSGSFQDGGLVTPNFPELDEASGIASQVGGYQPNEITTGRFDDAAAAQYMNPYVTQVLDRLQGRVKDRYNQDLQSIHDQSVAAGAYGGTRAALQGEQLRENMFRELGDVEAEQLASAYDRAGTMFTSDESRVLDAAKATETARQGGAGLQLNAGQGLAGIQQLRQGLTLDQSDALVRAGQLEQNQEQRAMDVAYEEFLRERGYDAEQARYLATILGSVQYAPNSSTQTTEPGPNPFTSVAGLGLAGLGMAGGLGWTPFAT